MANLALQQLTKSFDQNTVIHGIDLAIENGEFIVFVGPSGCGKSTLLRMIAGLEAISEGSLLIDGQDMTARNAADRGIAMVFQSYALYPNMSVRANLAYPLEMAKKKKNEITPKVLDVAQKLHLTELLDRLPRELSGGQRQRVAIGRAIIREPKIFLFDEPLSNLDAELRLQMRIEIAKLHEALGNTMIYVTHDQLEAMTLADRIVVFRDGRIEQVGKPLAIYHDPNNIFVAGFIGSPRMNFLKARVSACHGTQLQLEVADIGVKQLICEVQSPIAEGTELTLGIRPEHVISQVSGEQINAFEATIAYAEHLGHTHYLYLDIGGESMFVLEDRNADTLKTHASLRLAIDPQKVLLFDADGARVR
ncbi:ABC transporter ATP-binding protein [Celerinatantimonas diazotrophica]|uniref:Multiple sugar transport system ATP-binding protein n=1 Tax=Celerinatantimonas diazotrophica TaxID=412034 RepID=A0A4R1K222_9GAMM|nr:ABC transporter ATP-binding protein [Celerinatantimonas diazotrophica]TCK57723.1 multiple sugar transport system ATP-binding protein [Celerinatantimonas diazotrophica]CAG9298215.1 Maltose/maltodextrin import ATP-binding protein MalK [Celerinatantimonas diazotrophica]